MVIRSTSKSDAAGAVVIGGDFQTLGVIRSLAEHGVSVFHVEHEWGIARYSRYSLRRVSNDQLLQEGGVDFLIGLARREKLVGWTLFANDDATVKFLSVHRERLAETFRVALPEWEIVKKLYVKRTAYEIAERIGVPIPRMYIGACQEDILAQQPRFPLVLKPSFKENYYDKTHKKAIRVDNEEELSREFTDMAKHVEPSLIVVQEMIEGGPKHLYSFATLFDGARCLVGMSAIRPRQHPMDFGHATTFASSVHVPELEQLASRILSEIGYRGIAEVEFMWDDRDGCFKFIEVNARPWGWHTLARASGVNIPLATHRLLLDQEVKSAEPIEGVKWIRMMTDTPTVMMELFRRRMKLGEYLASFRGPKTFAVLSRHDPLPFIMEYLLIPYLWWKKGF